MRAVICGLLVAILVAITTFDRLACPDGCTETPSGSVAGLVSPSPACAFCQGWTAPPTVLRPAPLLRAVLGHVALAPSERGPHRIDIEHPPKPKR